jgi:hypothetical protein
LILWIEGINIQYSMIKRKNLNISGNTTSKLLNILKSYLSMAIAILLFAWPELAQLVGSLLSTVM